MGFIAGQELVSYGLDKIDPSGTSSAIFNTALLVSPLSERLFKPSGPTGPREPYIPRTETGDHIPLEKQVVKGVDIPLPDERAQGQPHTVLGGKVSSETGELYRQSASFPKATWPQAAGKDVPLSEVHWGDHGRPNVHPDPHQHIFNFDEAQHRWTRGNEPVRTHFGKPQTPPTGKPGIWLFGAPAGLAPRLLGQASSLLTGDILIDSGGGASASNSNGGFTFIPDENLIPAPSIIGLQKRFEVINHATHADLPCLHSLHHRRVGWQAERG